MKEGGFSPYSGEWWHFSDTDEYSYDDVDGIEIPHDSEDEYVPDCQEFISLRVSPSYSADTIRRILVGEHMTILGFAGDFVRVQVGSLQGYVAAAYIKPAV